MSFALRTCFFSNCRFFFLLYCFVRYSKSLRNKNPPNPGSGARKGVLSEGCPPVGSEQRSPTEGLPPVGSGATEGVLSEGYPLVGSVATEGVLSEGYMLVCLFVCPDQVLPQTALCTTNLPYKKHGGNFRAFYTASDDRISLPEA